MNNELTSHNTCPKPHSPTSDIIHSSIVFGLSVIPAFSFFLLPLWYCAYTGSKLLTLASDFSKACIFYARPCAVTEVNYKSCVLTSVSHWREMRGRMVYMCSHRKVPVLPSSYSWFQGLHVAAFVRVNAAHLHYSGSTNRFVQINDSRIQYGTLWTSQCLYIFSVLCTLFQYIFAS